MFKKGYIRPYSSNLSLAYRIFDSALIFSILWGWCQLHGYHLDIHYTYLALVYTLLFWISSEALNLYRSWRQDASTNLAIVTFLSWFIALFCILLIGFLTQTMEVYSRIILAGWLATTLAVLVGWRLLFCRVLAGLRLRNYNSRSAVILFVTDEGLRLAREIDRPNPYGIRFCGFFDDRSPERPAPAEVDIRGSIEDAVQFVKDADIDLVYVALPMRAEARIQDVLQTFSDTSATVLIIPNYFVFNLVYSRLGQVGEVMTLSIYDTPLQGVCSILKRIEDIVFGMFFLTLAAPLMLLAAVLVKLTSKGPVIFVQDRYGLDGRKIQVYKFRTMTTLDNAEVVMQATQNDPRVTRVGRVLRKLSIDELPQLINVLQGSMSLVGPRPHAVAHNEQYRKLIAGYMLRHRVKPGITGWAQVNGWRGETDTAEKMVNRVKCDIEYINNWSLWFDIKIILLTVFNGSLFNQLAY